ncbi:hypothetical protein PGRAN_12389 [Listeria grandensis FSL F6-0971]|uniref:Uncharacterized protein n=1 Tax=Listeria grandensis FSL F6-0971 TaxID=1265819 RepID=W7B9M1_9LIST|nr:hypothetical protein PGRAN_12389 [Listeria grandensis FSL F6-0971]
MVYWKEREIARTNKEMKILPSPPFIPILYVPALNEIKVITPLIKKQFSSLGNTFFYTVMVKLSVFFLIFL